MKQEKMCCFTEIAYILGILILALGTALMEKADFGMSMVVAPAYLLYKKLSQTLPWFTFGMAEYLFQAVLLAALCVALRRFRKSYLFSFVTAVLYGLALDLMIRAVRGVPQDGMAWRCGLFLVGLLLCAAGVAFFFRTYIAPEVYELFVKEIAGKYRLRIDKVKTVYDCVSCLAGIGLSFAFFGLGRFEGVKWGTVLCALVNGWLIGLIGKGLEAVFRFEDGLRLRELFSR